MKQKTERIIVKYLMNAANVEELNVLTHWLRKRENRKFFKNYVRTNYAMDMNTRQFNTDNAKKEYLRKIKQDKSVFYKDRLYKVLKYGIAASLIFMFGYLFRNNVFSTPIETTPIIANTSTIEAGTDKAILTLEDGSVVSLEKGKTFQIQNVNSNGEQIVYEAREQNSTEIAYNLLTIPRGGQFSAKLSDGTQVWLNSESQLKYPVSFKQGETRKVELIYGEAYFDVSPSTLHKGSKFKVYNESQEIVVLGTEFNIKAYKDEANIYTTVVDGRVSVNTNNANQVLKPNQQANLNLYDNALSIASVDVYNEVSWKEGVFSFEEKSLKEIMKVLSRWYNIDVVFKNTAAQNEEFVGVLDKDQNIEDILSSIKNSGTIKDYQIRDKEVILE